MVFWVAGSSDSEGPRGGRDAEGVVEEDEVPRDAGDVGRGDPGEERADGGVDVRPSRPSEPEEGVDVERVADLDDLEEVPDGVHPRDSIGGGYV